MKRLHIVVPYRARESHLRQFMHGLSLYFARDKIDRHIPYRVTVVEQEEGLPFNSGALKNIGFVLGREKSDYTCFHDVDYLPQWADYSWPEKPSAILWHGAEARPIRVGDHQRILHTPPEEIFGGVVLVPNNQFERVNGFANSYWGWGYEDTDLCSRFLLAGSDIVKRPGTFKALAHDSHGHGDDGEPSQAAADNWRLYQTRWPPPSTPVPVDGLSTLSFEILGRRTLTQGLVTERPADWEMVKVRLKR